MFENKNYIHLQIATPYDQMYNNRPSSEDTNILFTIAFRIGSESPFIERLVLVKTFS